MFEILIFTILWKSTIKEERQNVILFSLKLEAGYVVVRGITPYDKSPIRNFNTYKFKILTPENVDKL